MTHFRPISLTSLILSYTLFTIGNNAVTFITYELKNNPDRISMETAEKMKKLGTIGTIKIDKFLINVHVLNFKTAYGRDRWLVKPVSGSGEVWVENVTFNEEI